MINPHEFEHFASAMRPTSARAVYVARIVCFCGHTLPICDSRNLNEAMRAGIIFG